MGSVGTVGSVGSVGSATSWVAGVGAAGSADVGGAACSDLSKGLSLGSSSACVVVAVLAKRRLSMEVSAFAREYRQSVYGSDFTSRIVFGGAQEAM